MRIALISDIHSNYHALEAVLADIARRGVDRILCLGDITQKGPLPKECVNRVRDLGCPVVLGNTDVTYHHDFHPSRFPARSQSHLAVQADFGRHAAALTAEDHRWLTGFPLTLTERWEGVTLQAFHATPAHNYKIVMPWADQETLASLRSSADINIAAFGHNHRAFIRVVEGCLVVNAGSVGMPFDGDPRPGYALLDLSSGVTSAATIRVPYDAEAAIQAARQAGMSGWELFAHTARTGNYPG